ncbi:MAG: hypothetical protein V6Z82_03860 [Flavobacteriales bacterium]
MPTPLNISHPSLEEGQQKKQLESHRAYEHFKNTCDLDALCPMQLLADRAMGHTRHNVENNSKLELAKARKALEKAKALEAIQLAQGAKWVRETDSTWILRKAHKKKCKPIRQTIPKRLI